MKWTALNGLGAVFWIVGLYLVLGVPHAGSWSAWVPPNPVAIGSALSFVGFLTLLWANMSGA